MKKIGLWKSLSIALVVLLVSAFISSQDIDKLVQELSAQDASVREDATKKLIDMWESETAKKRVEETLAKAKKDQDLELINRTTSILDHHFYRSLFGKEIIKMIGLDKIDSMVEADDMKRVEILDEILSNSETRKLWKQEEKQIIEFMGKFTKLDAQLKLLDLVSKGSLKDYPAVAVQLLKSSDVKVRYTAISTLRTLKAKEFSKEIAKLLTDDASYMLTTPGPNPGVEIRQIKSIALETLIAFQANDCAKEIAELLQDKEPGWRARCVDALKLLGLKEYTKDIAKLLNDDSSTVRSQAVRALADFQATDYIKDIASLLKNKEQDTKYAALNALGKLGAKEHVKEIASLLSGKDYMMKGPAAEALGLIGAKDYTKQIAALLKDSYYENRRHAVVALGRLDAKDYAKDIANFLNLKDPDFWVRRDAMEALAKFGAKEHAKKIASMLSDRISWVRGTAIYALGKLDAKDYAKNIAKFIDDKSHCEIPGENGEKRQSITLGELADKVIRNWGLDPKDLK